MQEAHLQARIPQYRSEGIGRQAKRYKETKGCTNEEEYVIELAVADGNGPCSAHTSVRIFAGLWLNFIQKYVAHAWRLVGTLSSKGRVSDQWLLESVCNR
jgi:hypothetical protein